MVIDRVFLAHPRSVDESYLQHFRVAARIGALMIGGGLACLVHAVVPTLHMRTGSRMIRRLHGELSGRTPREAAIEALTWEI